VDAIRHGTTTLFDHHASPGFVDGSLDVIAEAVGQAGVRAVLCYEVSDRDGARVTDDGIKENLRFLKRLSDSPHPRLAGLFGLHASLTLSGATLQACRAALPEGAGFHVHVAEHEQDQYDSLQKSKMRVVERLQNHQILGDRTIAPCVHIDAGESG
jgi:cytosine/adenosine deaminase-related metal-dependent hydrolase